MTLLLEESQIRVKERRLTSRVQKIWRSRVNGRLPSWAEISGLDLGADRQVCFAVDLALSNGFPYFIFLGDGLLELSRLYMSDRAHWDITPMDLAAARMDEAALTRSPVHFNDVLRTPEGKRFIFRSVILPLSDNGVDVSHVFGAANGRGL